ncbi:SulP family inorganic anion transporter [Maricaulis salignorans]|uniref:Sulfate permease, SulP family n=1 Tax=Maricaulis salignorans TaxID=144026 RepID=A0A1G9W3E7_9PROT|nr:sulfate permease [Maricaulis salignorans]SDM79092.1 sulfate permease, SulP family [Maricaulis salignorans]
MQSEVFKRAKRLLPGLQWLEGYSRRTFGEDALASLITAILLIPQSLAYALLAGLPAQAGLYASIAPLVAYALFGSSRVLAVGPVAVVSLMTAAAIGNLGLTDPAQQMAAAGALAALSSFFLLLFGLFKLGSVSNFLSRPVVGAFVTASTILIIASQAKHILGISSHGSTLPELVYSMSGQLASINLVALVLGVGSIAFLIAARTVLPRLLTAMKIGEALAGGIARAAPAGLVVLATSIAWAFQLDTRAELAVVGVLPSGLPPLQLPLVDLTIWRALIGPAALISLIGFVESVSVGQSLAARRRESVNPDRELFGLGAANAAAALTGGYPVTGGFARSVVNEAAGAQTPLAGVFTAVIILAVAVFLTPLFHFLPKATLAATILVAVARLADFTGLWKAWKYAPADGAAAFLTLFGVIFLGVEIGLTLGVVVSVGAALRRTMRPHWTRVGQVPGTHHFRNPARHEVIISPHVYALRVDGALYFANARFLEELVADIIAKNDGVTDFVLMFPAVNFVDASALESLRAINQRLEHAHVKLHLSEVIGPVSDRLGAAGFLEELTGEVFLSQYAAMRTLDPATTLRAEGLQV